MPDGSDDQAVRVLREGDVVRRGRSVQVDVDGEPVRLCGVQGNLTPEAAETIADVVRAAKEQFDQLPARCMAREDGRVMPCLREPEHEPPHRTGAGREWT